MQFTKKKLITLLFIIYAQICFILSLRTNIFSIIQTEHSLPYSHIATLVLISGIIMQSSSYITGILIKKIGNNKTLILGLSSIGISALLMFFANTVLIFDILFTIFMFGMGVCSLVLNMYAGLLAGSASRGKVIMKLHLAASIGLCFGPTVISKLLSSGISWQIVVSLSSIPTFIFIFMLFFNNKSDRTNISYKDTAQSSSNDSPKYTAKNYIVWLFIVIFLCSQIWEYGVGTWFIIYAKQVKNISEVEASKYLTIFLISFPIGRLIYSKILDYVEYHSSILIAFCGNFVLILLGIVTKQLIFISLTGLFTSLMYPIIMSMMQEQFGENSSDLIGWICMTGGILQYIFIWSVGKIADNFGIELGFSSLIIYIIIGTVAVLCIKRLLFKPKQVCEYNC